MEREEPERLGQRAVSPDARSGWSDAFKAMAEAGDDKLLDPGTPTTFDEEEWEWQKPC